MTYWLLKHLTKWCVFSPYCFQTQWPGLSKLHFLPRVHSHPPAEQQPRKERPGPGWETEAWRHQFGLQHDVIKNRKSCNLWILSPVCYLASVISPIPVYIFAFSELNKEPVRRWWVSLFLIEWKLNWWCPSAGKWNHFFCAFFCMYTFSDLTIHASIQPQLFFVVFSWWRSVSIKTYRRRELSFSIMLQSLIKQASVPVLAHSLDQFKNSILLKVKNISAWSLTARWNWAVALREALLSQRIKAVCALYRVLCNSMFSCESKMNFPSIDKKVISIYFLYTVV